MTVLICDVCEARTRKPAIDLALLVACPRCAPEVGMFPGEHGPAHSYDWWKRRAGEAQRSAAPADDGNAQNAAPSAPRGPRS